MKPILQLTSGFNVETKAEGLKQKEAGRETSIVSYLFDHPREQWFKNKADKCVFRSKGEWRKEKVKGKQKETGRGRER